MGPGVPNPTSTASLEGYFDNTVPSSKDARCDLPTAKPRWIEDREDLNRKFDLQ
ncbi:unnamed protein product, partial [Symbiodinium necroappetens]